jgi:hypothetical protein
MTHTFAHIVTQNDARSGNNYAYFTYSDYIYVTIIVSKSAV